MLKSTPRSPPEFLRIGGKLLALMVVLVLIRSPGPGHHPTDPLYSIALSDPALTIPAADWPQLQRDPQHTGYSPQ
ncbi:MAG: hypothetical protein RMK65_02780 [Anaerolineae bacterium]|nr:hypothetical protein [Anaerolineae bacterium]MCX8066847.1 hypothetical protein [Anaerolineae bacterium]MDW7991067.1 hypothetical protein [Anaerolineae bacterium]